MAVTPSNMIPLGSACPDFTLPEPMTGDRVSRHEFEGRPLLVMFICNHCPFVKHVLDELVRIGDEFGSRGLGVVAISSNDVSTHPADSPEKMAKLAKEEGFSFPYLYDESQEVARAFDAACTPEFYLYNADHELVYRGQLDDSRPESDTPVTGSDLRAAIEATLKGENPPSDQTPSVGCNIKWKS